MKKQSRLRVVIAVLWSVVVVTGCGATPTPTPAPTPEIPLQGRWENFGFTSEALADNLIGDPATRAIYVYLPPNYDTSTARYPVVYGLHGYLDDPTSLQVWGRQLDSLIANDEAREMIFVLPDGGNKFGGSWYQSSPTIGDYESYIVHELVRYIDANYRTSSKREARGIAGCSMGGNGAMHLAFQYPEIFGAAASVSGGYAYGDYSQWEEARVSYSEAVHPNSIGEIYLLKWFVRVLYAKAAMAAPNPDNPPLYLDKPLEMVDGEARIVPAVLQKIIDRDVYHDLSDYLDQSVRLEGIAIYHGVQDEVPVEMARSFSEALTDNGVEHTYAEVEAGHCGPSWDYSPLLKFMSETLEQ